MTEPVRLVAPGTVTAPQPYNAARTVTNGIPDEPEGPHGLRVQDVTALLPKEIG